MKTCNGENCEYKIFGEINPGCNYMGYCDYQTPRDSRIWQISIEKKDIKDSDLIQ